MIEYKCASCGHRGPFPLCHKADTFLCDACHYEYDLTSDVYGEIEMRRSPPNARDTSYQTTPEQEALFASVLRNVIDSEPGVVRAAQPKSKGRMQLLLALKAYLEATGSTIERRSKNCFPGLAELCSDAYKQMPFFSPEGRTLSTILPDLDAAAARFTKVLDKVLACLPDELPYPLSLVQRANKLIGKQSLRDLHDYLYCHSDSYFQETVHSLKKILREAEHDVEQADHRITILAALGCVNSPGHQVLSERLKHFLDRTNYFNDAILLAIRIISTYELEPIEIPSAIPIQEGWKGELHDNRYLADRYFVEGGGVIIDTHVANTSNAATLCKVFRRGRKACKRRKLHQITASSPAMAVLYQDAVSAARVRMMIAGIYDKNTLVFITREPYQQDTIYTYYDLDHVLLVEAVLHATDYKITPKGTLVFYHEQQPYAILTLLPFREDLIVASIARMRMHSNTTASNVEAETIHTAPGTDTD